MIITVCNVCRQKVQGDITKMFHYCDRHRHLAEDYEREHQRRWATCLETAGNAFGKELERLRHELIRKEVVSSESQNVA